MVGERILHYQIERLLGAGGMGEVYLARDLRLERPVAIKVLPLDVTEQPEMRSRLLSEARAASRLNHPNILTIFAAEEAEGRDLIVMEYVIGRSLRQLIAAGPLPITDALDIAGQVAEGLGAAHAVGLIHRDIKPENIMLTDDGRAKIMDFGLAMPLETGASGSAGFAGTFAYASPEQIRGLPIDTRTDIWSLGVILHEMLAGNRPFQGEHSAEFAYAIVNDPPAALTALRSDIPEALVTIVSRCLEKRPANRVESAAAVAAQLAALLREFRESDGRKLIPSVAVLPFANLSSDAEQAYFCEGIAEEIINALAHVRGLRVAARVSSFSMSQQGEDARAIGKRLGVTALLEGSVRKTDTRLRITAQLVDVEDGFHLWSERYERPLTDVFLIQDEITKNVVRALEVVLSESQRRALSASRTHNVHAFDLYLRGRQFFHRRTKKALQFARELFSRAIEADPGYAEAHAGLADCWSLLIHFYGETADVSLDEALRASRRALELAPALAVSHAARGLALSLKGDTRESDEEFETAARLDPSLFDAVYLHGRVCFQRGALTVAARLFEQACDVADDHEAHYFLAQTLTALGRHDEAGGAYHRAVQSVRQYVDLNPDDARAHTMAAVALCRVGMREEGLKWAERALEIDPSDAGIIYNVACFFALEGEKDRALDCLEKAVRAGFAHGNWVEQDPDLESLRSDPRFKALTWRH